MILVTFFITSLTGGWKLINAFNKLTTATNNLAKITQDLQNITKCQGDKLDVLRTQQALDKADLITNQLKVKEDLVAHQASIGMELAVHMAKDEERFSAIAATLLLLQRGIGGRQ